MYDERSGSCLCGAVKFTTTGPLRGVVYCHCSQCRKQTGHMVAATRVADSDIEIEGTDHVAWYSASPEAGRGFCRTCGSVLLWKRKGTDVTSVMAGSFDQPSGLSGLRHIFVAEKGDYYEIDDSLPRFEQSS